MPPPPRDSWTLADWFERDYFRRPRRLRQWLGLAPRLTFLAGIALAALMFWPGQAALFQAAPVSMPHAMFNDDCQRCHRDMFQTPQRLLPGHAGLRSVSDQACLACHSTGPHHEEQQTSNPGCASCHREHRGTAALTEVADRHCTSCHGELHRKDGKPAAIANVTNFVHDHPEFAVWRQAASAESPRFHFSHQAHLQADGLPDASGKTVKLTCDTCHKPDAQRRNLQPVRYESHCASCHPLSVQLAGIGKGEKARELADSFRRQPAPHRPPSEVRAVLRERLTRLAEQEPLLLQAEKSSSDRPLPRELNEKEQREATAAAWVDRQLHESDRILFQGAGGCAYCHVRKPAEKPGALAEYLTTGLPRPGLAHSRFRHDSHQILRCTECHPATTSQRASDILLPRIETCQKCHNPRVGARSDCVECHRYHDRKGTRGWDGTWTIDELRR